MRKGGIGQWTIMLKRNRTHKVASNEIRSVKDWQFADPDRGRPAGSFRLLFFAIRVNRLRGK
jgi:hypothetical protein